MQQKEIKYTGITARPSGYDSPDGDLATAINLTNENGNFVPISIPKKAFTTNVNETLIYIHKSKSYSNYILYNDSNEIIFRTIENGSLGAAKSILLISDDDIIYQIESIGNVLCIFKSGGLSYHLYSDETYISLQDIPPRQILNFSISAERVSEPATQGIFGVGYYPYDIAIPYNKDVTGDAVFLPGSEKDKVMQRIKALTDTIFGVINKKIVQASEEGKFTFPALIRYALRLYDGSLIRHSAPIAAFSHDSSIICLAQEGVINGESFTAKGYSVRMYKYKLNCSINKLAGLDKWKDIIKSIDIFMSAPIYTIDINGYTAFGTKSNPNWLDLGASDNSTFINIPNTAKFYDETPTTSLFYKIHSIQIEDLHLGTEIRIDKDIIKTLTSQEVMTDDFRSNCSVTPSGGYVYNNRLNIFNIRTKLFEGFSLNEMNVKDSLENPGDKITDITIFIRKEDGQFAQVSTHYSAAETMPNFFFYPERNATKAVLTRENGSLFYIKLTPHQGLNGAYYFLGPDITLHEPFTHETKNNIEHSANQIKLSEVNNPFLFKAANSYSLGTGEILAISSATKALSQGQFGQFPLYAFTTEGIWALEVSEKGTYSARQPATRDVCNNPKSIMQLDGAIAFTTDQGIMLLSGSESKCISDILNGLVFDKSKLASFDKLLENIQLTTMPFSYIPFKEYLKGCQMSFDYPNSRIFIFNPVQPYSYVYNLKSNTWSIISESFKDTLNTYPDSYLSKENGDVVNLSSANSSRPVNAIIVTRPLKLDTPDLLKTITQAIHRGIFTKGDVKSVLYGSRDGINFILVTSSTDHTLRSTHGSPFKYFRFVIIAELSYGESISGTSIVFDTKQTNKLR